MHPFLVWSIEQVATPPMLEAWADVVADMAARGMWEVEIAWRIGALKFRKAE